MTNNRLLLSTAKCTVGTTTLPVVNIIYNTLDKEEEQDLIIKSGRKRTSKDPCYDEESTISVYNDRLPN